MYDNCENCIAGRPRIGRLVGVTRTLRLAVFDGEGVPQGTPQDLTGKTVVVRVLLDGTEGIFVPEFVIEGTGNNVVKFTWPANRQAVGNYTFDITITDGSGNVSRVNWHGRTGIRLVAYSNEVYGEDATGVKSNDEIGLIGYFTTSGEGMSAYEEWLASDESEGYERTVDGFFEWMRKPATDAADAAEAQMQDIQSRADEDHRKAGADHQTASEDHTRAGNDHTRAGNDHTRAEGDHTTAADDHRIAGEDHSTAVDDHTRAGQDHDTAAEDHRVAGIDHGTAADDHTRAGQDHQTASDDHTRAGEDHTQAGSDHTRAGEDHTRAGDDHQTAGSDHTRAGEDHTQAGSDHTRAGEDHTQAGNDHTRAEADHELAVSDHQTWANKADKDTDAVEGNLAKFNASGNPVDGGESLDNLARKDGSYEQMEVGAAKNLSGRTLVTDEFFARPTGGESAEVANGLGQLMEVAGNSVKYNQLLGSVNENNWQAGSGNVTSISFDNGVVTYTTKASGNNRDVRPKDAYGITFINSHKYFIVFSAKADVEIQLNLGFYAGGETRPISDFGVALTSSWSRTAVIKTSVNSVGVLPRYVNVSSSAATISLKEPMFIDLTALGIDNLTTVAEVEAWLAANWGAMEYYPYSPGALVNVNMTGLQSVSRNLLDPATGKAVILGKYSDVYGNYYGITGTHGTITFTDYLGNESTITPDSDGKFLIEVPGELSVASAGADCSVFHWWDGTQTDYSEHSVDTANLDITHIYGKLNGQGNFVQLWPTGMPKVNTVQDKLMIENNQVVAKRYVGEFDMGEGSWTYNSVTDDFRAYITGKLKGYYNVLCAKYTTVISGDATGSNVPNGKISGAGNDNRVFIKDTNYSDATTFTTAMSGVMLYYELATPEVYTDLVYMGSSLFADGTPVTLPVNYQVDNWGDEIVLPKNTSSAIVTAPPQVTMKYSVDAVEQLDTIKNELETTIIHTSDLKANLAALASYLCTNYPEVFTPAFTVNDEPNTGTKVFGYHEITEPEPQPEQEQE